MEKTIKEKQELENKKEERKIKTKKENINDVHEFHPLNVEIEERSINPIGRFSMWIIIFIITFGGLWLYYGKIDIVISRRGTVIPEGEIKVLQPMETGVISKILIKEGDYVKKGEILIEIDPTVTETNLDSKNLDLKVLEYSQKRLNRLINEKSTLIYKSIDKISNEQFNLFNIELNSYKENINRFNMKTIQLKFQLKSLNSEGINLKNDLLIFNGRLIKLKRVIDIIAKNEFIDIEQKRNNTINKIDVNNFQKKELNQKIAETNEEKKNFINDFKKQRYEELINIKKELRLLKTEIERIKFKSKKQKIISPVDGYVIKLMVNTIGGVVTTSEKLVTIVPKDMKMIVKSNVLNKDIGFIKDNLEVKIKSDTFSFQKYGFFTGKVINVGAFSIEDEQLGSIYEIKVQPKNNEWLEIDGVKRKLEPGMSVTTEVKVGKRRIIEFFVYPIVQYLDEGMSVK